MKDKLPYICPEHPNANILHTWEEVHSFIGGYPAGSGYTKNHKYECQECGRQLSYKKGGDEK
jgi:hypothetical protein